VAALLCFAFWPNIYKASQTRWRFEFFAIDFAAGALLVALITAYTFGTLGHEMSFGDRMLVAGREAGLWIVVVGAIFAFGNLLLLVSSTLLGLSGAFPIAFGTAALLVGLTHFRFLRAWAAVPALLLFFASGLCAAIGSGLPRPPGRRKQWIKGIGLAIFAGFPVALVQWMLRHTANPEFGPGPYASILMFGLGLLLLTPAYDFFFMHIKIVGNPIGFAHYKLGGFRIHLPGLIAGGVFIVGLLMLLLALSATGEAELSPLLAFSVPLLSVAATMLAGLLRWREYADAKPLPRSLLWAATICFAAGSILLGLAYST
jgi:glucose uptake protein